MKKVTISQLYAEKLERDFKKLQKKHKEIKSICRIIAHDLEEMPRLTVNETGILVALKQISK